jgi:NAD(P)-dependent dehydrogenase (short-subunit alcohol dehydrogenase family)
LFVNLLRPLLDPASGRVVALSSAGHRFADVDLEDPNFERTPYQPFVAYGRSKTANVLFAVGLDQRLRVHGARATAVHPGVIRTELSRYLTPELIQQASGGKSLEPVALKSIPQGAATTVWAGFTASAGEVGGRYCEDCHLAEGTKDPTLRSGVRAYALDPARAAALWERSEELVGQRFPG